MSNITTPAAASGGLPRYNSASEMPLISAYNTDTFFMWSNPTAPTFTDQSNIRSFATSTVDTFGKGSIANIAPIGGKITLSNVTGKGRLVGLIGPSMITSPIFAPKPVTFDITIDGVTETVTYTGTANNYRYIWGDFKTFPALNDWAFVYLMSLPVFNEMHALEFNESLLIEVTTPVTSVYAADDSRCYAFYQIEGVGY